MKASFTTTKKGTWAYIRKSVRIEGKSTTVPVKSLGLLSDIQKNTGCADPLQWVVDLARKMTEDERTANEVVELPFRPGREIAAGDRPLRTGGDLLLSSLYTELGLPGLCRQILKESRAKYDLNEILKTLTMGRILFPASKAKTLAAAKDFVFPPKFKEEEMYRALSLLSEHIDTIQAEVYRNSLDVIDRRQRVIYYDCTNYFFEIEDNDKDYVDHETGEVVIGLRKRGKSKENRPNPIVQMGLFMDMDGIPLAFTVFPGNESEQKSLQPLEKLLSRKFDMTEFIVSTDAGLGSEDNRTFNMVEGRDYICVQSIPSLKAADQDMAIAPEGWRIAYCADITRQRNLEEAYGNDGIFKLDRLLEATVEYPTLLKDMTFYKEIIVVKEKKTEKPQWRRKKAVPPGEKPCDENGTPIPHHITSKRNERVIVTYSHDFALYLKHKRQERLTLAARIVRNKQTKSRTSQQSPLNYVETIHRTTDGTVATKVEMQINDEAVAQEERFDGFYAYGTSLEDAAIDVLRARSFHHEIEHLFRTTKTFLDARPVYLSRQDRIKAHFLICFLSMVILKILQTKTIRTNEEYYREEPLSIDALIGTLRSFKFGTLPRGNYQPMFTRTTLTDQLQAQAGVNANAEIISPQKMRALYKKVNKS